MTYNMGHGNLTENQAYGTPFGLQHHSLLECAITEKPQRSFFSSAQGPRANRGVCVRERARWKVQGAVMFCSYISWVVINVFSDWEMNEVFLWRTQPINFFSFLYYYFVFKFCLTFPFMVLEGRP